MKVQSGRSVQRVERDVDRAADAIPRRAARGEIAVDVSEKIRDILQVEHDAARRQARALAMPVTEQVTPRRRLRDLMGIRAGQRRQR